MGWFRLRRGACIWLVLAGLALQLALSFGHVHGLPDARPVAAASEAATSDAPAPPAHNDHDEDYCPSCAILTLLAGAAMPSAPAVLVPLSHRSAEVAFLFETIRAVAPFAAFRSRAPPLT